MTGQDLDRTQGLVLSDDEMRRSWRVAEALARSGVFPDAKTAEEAFAKMLIGRDLGLSPTQAMMGIYLVDGKPMVGYTLLGSFVKRHEHYDYVVMAHNETQCEIEFTQDGETLGISKFTIEDAKAANLIKSRGPWEKYPKTMLLARALSQGVRWYCPDATGGVPVYVEGEIVEVPQLTSGDGTGEAQGLDLGPKVEKVIERATALGHGGLSDRATIEMTLGGRSPEIAVKFVADAEAELDRYEEAIPSEAIVVMPGESEASPEEQAAQMARIADQLREDADEAEQEGKPEEAASLRAKAEEVRP